MQNKTIQLNPVSVYLLMLNYTSPLKLLLYGWEFLILLMGLVEQEWYWRAGKPWVTWVYWAIEV